jgi:predicted RNA binding protein YcfA (HicA-like mRNA interferase family)
MNLPILSAQDVVRGLLRNGFTFVSQRGSHRKYTKNGFVVIVPMHRELARGTLRAILEQANLTIDKLLDQ